MINDFLSQEAGFAMQLIQRMVALPTKRAVVNIFADDKLLILLNCYILILLNEWLKIFADDKLLIF